MSAEGSTPLTLRSAVKVARHQHRQGLLLGFLFGAAVFAPWWPFVAVLAAVLVAVLVGLQANR